MKNVKKIISSLLVVAIILTAAPLSGFAGLKLNFGWLDFSTKSSAEENELAPTGQCGDNVFWSFDKSIGLLTISGSGKMSNYGYSNPPFGNTSITKVVIEDGITNIGNYVFNSCGRLTSITIPDSVTSIGDGAFYGCTSLTSIIIPNNVTSIGSSAFYGCTGLTSIIIPNNVTSIGRYAFRNCTNLTNITIPDSVTSIGSSAFDDCKELTSIIVDSNNAVYDSRNNCNAIIEKSANKLIVGCKNTIIPDSVINIGDTAFFGRKGLTSMKIPDSIVSIGCSAFKGCTDLTNIIIPNNVTSIGSSAFYGCTSLTSIIIPDSVTRIESAAFCGCTGLTSITIGNGLTSINSETFYGCTSLTSVTIGNSVTSIGYRAFEDCTGLTNITIPDSVTNIVDGAFCRCIDLTSIRIGNSVTSIGKYVFKDCKSLTNITIPDSVTSIGEDSFKNCKSLTNIIIPDSVTSIGDGAFYGCTSLTSIIIPNNVTSIGSYTFYGCTGLTSIIIPNNVTSIGSYAFYVCSGLTSIIIPNKVTSIGSGAFRNCTNLTNITIPDSVTSIGSYAFYGCTGLTSIIIPNKVTSIGSCAFRNCTNLTNITIPDSVTSIGSSAFDGCTGLKTVNYKGTRENWCRIKFDLSSGSNPVYYSKCLYINGEDIGDVIVPNDVKEISAFAFINCQNLTSIIIPDSATSIGGYAFEGCTGLTSIIIPDSVTSIDFNAFEGCNSLTSVTIGNSVTSIGYRAFKDCTNLTNIKVGNSVTGIGAETFYGCTSLTSIIIPNSVTGIGAETFRGCTGLISVTIGNSVTSIEYGTFENCTSLTSIIIPDSATSIGGYAFEDCTGLTSIIIPDSVTSIGNSAFSGCTNLTNITIPDGVTSIGSSAFYRCVDLTSIIIPDNITSISSSVFERCGLTSIIIPDSVTSIDSYAFEECTSLTSVTIPNSVTSIGGRVFAGCGSLKSLTIPNSVTSIGEYAFSDCRSLTNISIPNSITAIKYGTFSGCIRLTNITLPDSITAIGHFAFSDCKGLKSIIIPDSVTSIGESAFYGYIHLTDVYYEGSSDEWNKISIAKNNERLTKANIHYMNHCEQNTSPSDGEYKLIFNVGSGKFKDGNNQKVYYFNEGDKLTGFTSFIEKPTRSGFEFFSWSPKSSPSLFYIFPSSMPAKDIVLNAIWSVEGEFQDYTTAVVLNGNKSYASDVTIDGKQYQVSGENSISLTEADSLMGSRVIAYLNNDKICFIEKKQKSIPHSSTYKTSSTEYGQVKYETEEEYKVLESANAFVEKMKEYYNSFGEYLGEDGEAIDYNKFAKDLKKNDPGYFGSVNLSSSAEDALYYALAKFIIEVADNNKLYLKIKTSASVTQNAINLTNSIKNSIVTDSYVYNYKNYEVTFNVLIFSSAFTGDFSIVKCKGLNNGEKSTGIINSSVSKTQQAMTDYLNNLGDLVEDECKMAICSMYNEFMSLTGLAEAKDEAIERFFSNVSGKFVKKFGDVYKAFIAIKTGYNVLSKLRKFNNITTFLEYQDNATKIYNTIKELDFSEKGIKNRATKKSIAALKTAQKDLLDHLYNYIYHSNSGDPENRSALEKTGDWFKGLWDKVIIACPVEFEIYDENNNLIGYVDSSSAHDEYIYFNDDIFIEVKDDIKYIYYPADMQINLKLTAYEDGKMDFSIEQFMDGSATGKVVYNDIPLSKEESYNQTLSKNIDLRSTASENSTISTEFNTSGTYYDVEDSEANIRVNCIASDGGKVIYYEQSPIGSVVNIYAFPEEGYQFIGWICDDACVSKNSCYSFIAKTNVTYIAKFSKTVSDHNHSFSNDWKSDQKNHWKECECGEKTDVAAHVEGEWKVTKPATTTSTGIKALYCSVCNVVIRTEDIPKLDPSNGSIKSVSIDDISLNYKKSTTLKPTIKADDGVKYTVEYSTSNPKVATVDKSGKVTATKRGSGTATITCTVTDFNGNVVKDTCKVNVKLSFGQWLIVIVLFGWIWY